MPYISEIIRENRIDRAAKAIREHQMAGRFTVEWERLPKGQKRKWIEVATKAIDAADTIPPSEAENAH